MPRPLAILGAVSPRIRTAALPLLAAASLALSACATGPGTDGPEPHPDPIAVVGQGMVLQVGDALPQFCLGAIAESYPPQCSGPELLGWDWDAVDGEEVAEETTFGMYAVWGDWTGQRLETTSAITLALYDPMPVDDPKLDPANAGTATEAQLIAAQDELPGEAPVEILSSWVENGYLFAQVVFDDGSVQEWADSKYGPDVVEVRSALWPVEG